LYEINYFFKKFSSENIVQYKYENFIIYIFIYQLKYIMQHHFVIHIISINNTTNYFVSYIIYFKKYHLI